MFIVKIRYKKQLKKLNMLREQRKQEMRENELERKLIE